MSGRPQLFFRQEALDIGALVATSLVGKTCCSLVCVSSALQWKTRRPYSLGAGYLTPPSYLLFHPQQPERATLRNAHVPKMDYGSDDEQTLHGNGDVGEYPDTTDAVTLNGADPNWLSSTAPLTANDLFLLEKDDIDGWHANTAQNPPSVNITAASKPIELPKTKDCKKREVYTVNYVIDPAYTLTLTNTDTAVGDVTVTKTLDPSVVHYLMSRRSGSGAYSHATAESIAAIRFRERWNALCNRDAGVVHPELQRGATDDTDRRGGEGVFSNGTGATLRERFNRYHTSKEKWLEMVVTMR